MNAPRQPAPVPPGYLSPIGRATVAAAIQKHREQLAAKRSQRAVLSTLEAVKKGNP